MITETALLFIKIAAFIIAGLLLGIGGKVFIRTYLQKKFLKKVLQNEPSVYNHVSLLIRMFTESFQWIVILLFLNYALLQLDIKFLNTIFLFMENNISTIISFIAIIVIGIIISKVVAARIKYKEIQNSEQISLVAETIILFAFILTGLELIGIKATALSDLYRVILYVIGAIIVVITSVSFIRGKKTTKKK